jgi:outer membrane immunogenic protein
MRRLAVLMTMMVIAQGAQAADLPDFLGAPLRGGFSDGPTGPVNWQGFYVGGQAAAGQANMNFTNSTSNLISQMLAVTTVEAEMQPSGWPLMGKTSSAGTGFGGFAGYNAQWEDVVLSLEASYLHTRFQGDNSGSMARQQVTSDNYNNAVDVTGSANMLIHDMASARLRAGYATGNFLPYAFAGMSLGFADITRSASASDVGTYVGTPPAPPNYAANYSLASQQKNQFIYGYAAGFGVDWSLFNGIFLRGEYEYLRFMTPIDVSINTVRGGVGVKF